MTVEVSRRSILIGGMAVLATALPVPAMASGSTLLIRTLTN